MTTNSEFFSLKTIFLCFVNKGAVLLYATLTILILLPLFAFSMMLLHDDEFYTEILIFSCIALMVVLIKLITAPLNGIFIRKKGTVVFVLGSRIKKAKVEDLKRFAISFTEWPNNKYSASVKIVYKNGKIYKKDYAHNFVSPKPKRLFYYLYTISQKQMDVLCQRLLDVRNCCITVIDKNGDAVYQKLST